MTKNAADSHFAALELIYDLVCATIEKAQSKESTEILRSEERLARLVTREWNVRATNGTKKILRQLSAAHQKPFTANDGKAILQTLDDEFGGLDDATARATSQAIDRSYRVAKERFVAKHRSKLQRLKSGKRLSPFERLFLTKDGTENADILALTSTDQEAISNLTRLHLVAVGDHYPKNVKPALTDALVEGVVARGLPKREAGQFVMDELARRLGGFIDAVPASIRRQGQEAARSYFEGLATTSLTRARGFSALNLMNDAGITNYRWFSVIDNRTSEICLAMDGRIFPVELGRDQMRRILEQNSADGLIETAGWRKDLSEFDLNRGHRLDSFDVANLLSAQGVPIVPPAHYRCRSELAPA